MHDLIDTTEMYLRTVLELIEEGQVPMRARISERLDHSGPTVSQTVARMERDGLISRRRDLADARRTVVQATTQGLARVGELSSAIEAHYAAIEGTLGKDQLMQLYALLDALIAMEQPHATETPS